MRILRAYSGLGNELPSPGAPALANDGGQRRERQQVTEKGDTVNLSAEARQALADGEAPLAAQAADATYDQHGNVTRQFHSVQGELRSLAASLMGSAEGASVAGHLNTLKTQLRSLEARV